MRTTIAKRRRYARHLPTELKPAYFFEIFPIRSSSAKTGRSRLGRCKGRLRLFQRRIFDIGVGQGAFALIEPFDPFIGSRLPQIGDKECLRLWIILSTHHGDVQRHESFLDRPAERRPPWYPRCSIAAGVARNRIACSATFWYSAFRYNATIRFATWTTPMFSSNCRPDFNEPPWALVTYPS